jgi:hypothetical protein
MVTGSERLGPLSDYTANRRPVLSSERYKIQDRKFQTGTFRQEIISGHKPNLGCLHPVARVISYDVGFNPFTQRHYRIYTG